MDEDCKDKFNVFTWEGFTPENSGYCHWSEIPNTEQELRIPFGIILEVSYK